MTHRILAFSCFLLVTMAISAQQPELIIPTGYPYGRATFKMTPDGKYFIGKDDDNLILWEGKSLRQLRTFALERSKIYDFAISPDSRYVTAFCNNDVQCFEIQTGKKRWGVKVSFTHYGGTYFNKGDKIAVLGTDDGYILSASTGVTISTLNGFGAFEAHGFTLADNRVLKLTSETYEIYNPATNTIEPVVQFDAFKKRWAVSEKLQLLFVISTGSQDMQVYDLKTNRIIKTIICPTQEPIIGTTVEGDALLLRGLDPNAGNYYTSYVRKYSLPGFESKVLTMSDMGGDYDGQISGSAAQNFVYGESGRVRRISDGKLVGDLTGQINEYGVMLTEKSSTWPEQQRLGFESDGAYQVLDLTSGQHKGNLKSRNDLYLWLQAFSPDGKTFAGYVQEDNTVRLFDLVSGNQLRSFPVSMNLTDRLFSFSAKGDRLYLHNDESRFCEMDLQTGAIKARFATFPSPEFAFSENGEYVAALDGSRDGWTVAVWEISTGKELLNVPHVNNGYNRDFVLSPDGKTVVVIDEAEAAVYSTVTKAKVATPDFTDRYGFAKGFWNADNSRMAITGDNRGVRLIDRNYNQTAEAPYSGKAIRKIIFTRKGNVYFTVETNQIGIYSVSGAKHLGTYYSFRNSKDWLVVTPDGRYDGSPEAFSRLYYLKGLEVLPLESLFEKYYTPGLYGMLVEGTPPPPAENVNNLKPAPTIRMQYENQNRNLSVEDDVPAYSTNTKLAKITVVSECPEDGVAEIRLFHNGKLVGAGTRNLIVEEDNPEKKKTQSFELELSEGENRLRAIALNTQRTESQPDEIAIVLQSKSAPEGGRGKGLNLHLLVVGINSYKNPKYNLNYATADASGFKAALEKSAGSIFAGINAAYLSDDKATRAGIAAELDKIKAVASAQDVFIFYFAGHGVLNGNKEFYLVPHDVTQLYGNDDALAQKGFSATQLQDYSRDIKAQKQLFILDACQSAGALETVSARGVVEEKAIAQLARSTGTHWLTASGSEQFASEFAQLGHGTFTYALLEGLAGKADGGGDRKITVKELDSYLQDRVPEITAKYKGTPQFPASYGFGNDFPVGVASEK